MKKFNMKICPWKDGQGWQEHCIADRQADTIADLFVQLNRLQLDMDCGDGNDYSVDIYNSKIKIVEFWLSEYLQNGVEIDGVKYGIETKTEKEKFFDWLDGLVKEECKTDKFREASWSEAQEKDACGMSFELSARHTLSGRPYSYRLS